MNVVEDGATRFATREERFRERNGGVRDKRIERVGDARMRGKVEIKGDFSRATAPLSFVRSRPRDEEDNARACYSLPLSSPVKNGINFAVADRGRFKRQRGNTTTSSKVEYGFFCVLFLALPPCLSLRQRSEVALGGGLASVIDVISVARGALFVI